LRADSCAVTCAVDDDVEQVDLAVGGHLGAVGVEHEAGVPGLGGVVGALVEAAGEEPDAVALAASPRPR
jgi:hypothetical protein